MYLYRHVSHIDFLIGLATRQLFLSRSGKTAQTHVALFEVLPITDRFVEDLVDLFNDEVFADLEF